MMMDALTSSMSVLMQVTEKSNNTDGYLGSPDLAATKAVIDNDKEETDVILPLHTVSLKTNAKKRRAGNVKSPSLVGARSTPYPYGEKTDQPSLTVQDGLLYWVFIAVQAF